MTHSVKCLFGGFSLSVPMLITFNMPQLTKLKRKYNLTRFNRTSASLGERRGSISEADPQINMLLLG